MLVDFIRNSGQLTKDMRKNQDLLDIELNFWGIDKTVFREKQNQNFTKIQDLIDQPYQDYFYKRTEESGDEFFFESLRQI
jgi:hypothetical protein